MDFQTEHLDNHTARLTVKIEAERLEQAMQDAARRIAKKARIKGFRPGKAPYNVILNLYGREYVVAEAVDVLGQVLYKEALDASGIDPYSPGTLEDVKSEDGLTLVFSMPKRPEIDLGGYRDIVRADVPVEEITDEQVTETMEVLRAQQAVIEDVSRPAQMLDQVVLSYIQVEILPDEAAEAVAEGDADAESVAEGDADAAAEATPEASTETAVETAAAEDNDAESDDEHDHEHGETENEVLMHRHNWQRVLDDTDKRDLFPGFSAELVGLGAGDEKTFTLALPADYDDADLAGRTLHCEVSIEKVQARTLPEWSDDLAKRISDEEFDTLLALRVDIRKQLTDRAEAQAKNKLVDAALDQLVATSTLHYPEEIVSDYEDDILEEMDRNLQQQGIKLDDYIKMMGKTRDDFKTQYRDAAVRRAERALVLGQLLQAEGLKVDPADIDAEVNRMAAQFGGEEQAGQFLKYLNMPQSRANITSQLLNDRVLDRLVAIAKGENPPLGPAPVAEAVEAVAEAVAEAATDAAPEASAEAAPNESSEASNPAPAADEHNS